MQSNPVLVLLLIISLAATQIKIQNLTSAMPTSVSPNESQQDPISSNSSAGLNSTGLNPPDPYEYRYIVAEGVQNALDECRERFKWDRWSCPKKLFLNILERNPLPSNRELAYLRALIASSVVLSLTRSCSVTSNKASCGCSANHIPVPTRSILASGASVTPKAIGINHLHHHSHQVHHSRHENQLMPSMHSMEKPNQSYGFQRVPTIHLNAVTSSGQPTTAEQQKQLIQQYENDVAAKFAWQGCDESIDFAFLVSKVYLDTLNSLDSVTSQQVNSRVIERINGRNFEAGRIAVRKNMRKVCKCHGLSGSCQMSTCWTEVPTMGQVGEYLRRQYKFAAKVGATNSEETELSSLNRELSHLSDEKLVFADPSPDYCYENPQLDINGTLGRYCSRTRFRPDGKEVTRSERDSCDRLCTKCGYKIKREVIQVEKQCDCRFVYCCSVECKRCLQSEMAYKCVRHS